VTNTPADNFQDKLHQLRSDAEAKAVQSLPALAVVNLEGKLLHELEVHQIELEMQNNELQLAHLALEKSRNFYLNLFELAPVGYLALNAKGLIAEANLPATLILGVERNKLLLCPFSRYMTPESADRHYLKMLRLTQGSEQQNYNIEILREDDTLRNVQVNALNVEAKDSRISWLVTLMDFTERKKEEDDLRAQKDKRAAELVIANKELSIAAITFESQEGMFVTDAKGVILRVNRAFTKITGYSAEEAVGQKPPLMSSGLHDAPFYAAMWQDVIQHGFWSGEVRNRRKSGEDYPEYLNITTVKDATGLVTNYVATLMDITGAKQQEQQRLAHEVALRKTLVREVHHRIKNNLQGVTGILSNFSAQYPELLVPIKKAISQVQTISVIHGLQGRSSIAKVRLCELTKEIAANNNAIWHTQVSVDIPANWLPCLIVETEAVPIALVLNELITNAIKHSDPAKKITITIRHKPQPEMIQLIITNHGHIPPNLNLSYSSGTSTGLQLITSLLPKKGAYLNWEQHGDKVAFKLELESPVVTLEQMDIDIS